MGEEFEELASLVRRSKWHWWWLCRVGLHHRHDYRSSAYTLGIKVKIPTSFLCALGGDGEASPYGWKCCRCDKTKLWVKIEGNRFRRRVLLVGGNGP